MDSLQLFVISLFIFKSNGIDHLPCTNKVDQMVLDRARHIILASTPPGYRLIDLVPIVTSGRNPHRWQGSFSRNDNRYETGCAFLQAIKRILRENVLQVVKSVPCVFTVCKIGNVLKSNF
ncbi:hypothetical protein HHI36_018169, partial [Cryptolaemus montrouzieri]